MSSINCGLITHRQMKLVFIESIVTLPILGIYRSGKTARGRTWKEFQRGYEGMSFFHCCLLAFKFYSIRVDVKRITGAKRFAEQYSIASVGENHTKKDSKSKYFVKC